MPVTKSPTQVETFLRPIHDSLTRRLSPLLAASEIPEEPAGADEFARTVLRDAVREGASDIHFEPQRNSVAVRFRVDGALLDAPHLTREQGVRMIRHFKAIAGLDPADSHATQTGRIPYELDGRTLTLRLATAPTMLGETLCIRILDFNRATQQLVELGLSRDQLEPIRLWLSSNCGLFLVAGPIGSGKTTTLYSLLHELRLTERSVLTIEQPVEFLIDGLSQIQVEDRRGLSLDSLMRSMLLLDPDYVLLGEIRSRETAARAVEVATMGRSILSTLHSRDAASTVTTLRKWGISDPDISAAMQMVIAQRLVRRLCAECRQQREPSDDTKRWFEIRLLAPPELEWTATGCDSCRQRGYHGRIGVFEVWLPDEGDLELIRHGADEQTIRAQLAERGHRFLLDDALERAAAGTTSHAEVVGLGGNLPVTAE